MAINTILQTVYSSAPADELLISTLEIRMGGGATPIRLLEGYDDMMLGVDGTMQLFEATAISIALPETGTQGNQTLKFGFSGISSHMQNLVTEALTSGEPSYIYYREYLLSNPSQAVRNPYKMFVIGGEFDRENIVLEASYMDMLNLAWPRERYTNTSSPGIAYML